MSIKTGKKIGFFAALTILVGSVVGIGIFFKNGSVLGATENSGSTTLLTWIVGGLLALFAAISFSGLGDKLKTKNVHGLPAWSEINGGKKFGYFVRFNYFVFYFGILTSLLGFFVSELFFVMIENFKSGNGINVKIPAPWVHALVGIAFSFAAILTNVISIKASSKVQMVTTVLKFAPLLLALIIGIAMPNTHHNGGKNYFTNDPGFTFTGLLAALPAVLFAYDAFLIVASLPEKTKGGTKTVSKVVLFGLIFVVVLYSLIAVSSMLHGGSIGSIITDSLPSSAASGLNIFVFTFLFISGYGVLNGLSAGLASYAEQNYKINTVFGTTWLKNKLKDKGLYLLLSFISIFGWLVSVMPSMIVGKDGYVDAASNFIVLFFFAIYGITILMFLLKNKDLSMLIKISGWIFVVGVALVVLYQIFYGFTIKFWTIDEFGKNETTHLPIPYTWTTTKSTGVGLFAPGGPFVDSDFFIMFLSYTVIFFGLPSLNLLLKKRVEKEDPIINTQV